ncbi:hypothetical protein [Stutzerimonas kunmingensis]|uniref:hypothetical protein n=1 Tax=Stutzerimonas kunmingensis TaxID=1211807 RepID=UPI002430C4F3|nr:hypothetical protein [Stutzerimonas kunmingensis]
MTHFLRLLTEQNKESALVTACQNVRQGHADPFHFELTAESFDAVPGKPFAYWVSEAVRQTFQRLGAFENEERSAKQGLSTAEDFRFVRANWEINKEITGWYGFAKGGSFGSFYQDIFLSVNWKDSGKEIKAGICRRYPYLNDNWEFVAKNSSYYGRPGVTWPRRSQIGLSVRALPAQCIFADVGPSAFVVDDADDDLLLLLSICNSSTFRLMVRFLISFGKYEVGAIQRMPMPTSEKSVREQLVAHARRAWSLKRTLDTIEETSHAFVLPGALRARLGDYDPPTIEAELAHIQADIDGIAFDLYGFSDADRVAAQGPGAVAEEDADTGVDDDEDEESAAPIDQTAGLLSWAVGVAFGRFDWRLATGERAAPAEPEPFDPLPAKSPGMLPDGAVPFHSHAGILVDDPGHPHDLTRLIEEVLARVEAPVPEDVRRWLQRDFFAFHLQRYSKSRRKAPIYWPLSTTSGGYTLWVYYPSLTSQTLYTAINDFVEPKLKQVGADVTALRNKGSARTRDDEKQFEALQAFELELIELRDTLLKLAPTYKPNQDDGVQISAAPLWPLFRHKPWQKVLKDTWAKLEKGDYDWAHLAMNYWPERVREKCKTDKSLAIAHGLEELYIEPKAAPKKARKKKVGGDE